MPDDFTDDELNEMAAGHLLNQAQREALAEGDEAEEAFREWIAKGGPTEYDHEGQYDTSNIPRGSMANEIPGGLRRGGTAKSAGDFTDDGRWHYERVPIKGAVSRGAFRLPGRVIDTLGKGDPRTGGAIAAHLFRVDPDDPLTISPDKVREVGQGDIGAGQRVLRKFVAMLRKSGAQSTARQR